MCNPFSYFDISVGTKVQRLHMIACHTFFSHYQSMKFLSGAKIMHGTKHNFNGKVIKLHTTPMILTCIEIFARKLLLDMTKAKKFKEKTHLLPSTNDTIIIHQKKGVQQQ